MRLRCESQPRAATASLRVLVAVFALLLCGSQPASAQFVQQGLKLVGGGYSGMPGQGVAAALSGDGNTAIIGGSGDNCATGAAWVFSRNGGIWSQQGSKLVGPVAGNGCNSREGQSVALSADGNTAIVGAPYAVAVDNSSAVGGAFVFIRRNGAWTQQGPMLVGISDNGKGYESQGWSVALSADGNTAIMGAPYNNYTFETGYLGGAYIFTRSNGTWTQQGPILAAADAVAFIDTSGVELGFSVALSADGDTAIVGGPADNSDDGAAWIFTRSNGAWTQQGAKLVGSGPSVSGHGYGQGSSVALSNDGNTAIVGAPQNPVGDGAAWIFARSGGSWSQQGPMLVGTGASGFADQGFSVALSGDGNIAMVGGPSDATAAGATWVFTRGNGNWTQQGSKLVGTGAAMTSFTDQGQSVALAADGATAIIGGGNDNGGIGAAWVFASGSAFGCARVAIATHDFNCDGMSDILWRDTVGNVALWLMNAAMISSSALVSNVSTAWTIAGQRDFDGDGKSDILWRDTGGNVAMWLMNGATVTSSTLVANVPIAWSIAGTGDFDSDGKGDILWRDSNGDVAIWLMNGTTISSNVLVASVSADWSIAKSAGNTILWRNTAGDVALWKMNGGLVSASHSLGNVPTNWTIVGLGDFDGDGIIDILWHDVSGNVAIWLLNGSGQVSSSIYVGNVPDNWSIVQTGDFDGDGKSDILWRDSSGNVAIWLMNGGAVSSNLFVANVSASWSIQSAGAD